MRHRFELNRFRNIFHTERNTGGMTVTTSTVRPWIRDAQAHRQFLQHSFLLAHNPVEPQRAMLDAETRRQLLVGSQIHPPVTVVACSLVQNIFLVMIHGLTNGGVLQPRHVARNTTLSGKRVKTHDVCTDHV